MICSLDLIFIVYTDHPSAIGRFCVTSSFRLIGIFQVAVYRIHEGKYCTLFQFTVALLCQRNTFALLSAKPFDSVSKLQITKFKMSVDFSRYQPSLCFSWIFVVVVVVDRSQVFHVGQLLENLEI